MHDYVREMERRTVVQPKRKSKVDEVGNPSLEAGFVWLETNATVPETDAICERLSAMEIGTFSSSTTQTISGEPPGLKVENWMK